MKRKVLALTTIMLVLALLLCACAPPPSENAPAAAAPASPADDSASSESEPAEEDKIVIGVSTDSASSVFRYVQMFGAYEAAKAAGNVEIIELIADNDTALQNTQIKTLVDQGCDVIVCAAIDKDTILSAFDYVQAAGIPLICYDRAIDHPHVSYNVIYDSVSDANLLGNYIVSRDKDGAPKKVLLTVGSLADPNGIARRDGFYEIVDEHENIEVIEVLTDWKVDQCLANMQNALQLHPDVWAVVNVSAHMDGAIMSALEEAGLKHTRDSEDHVIFATLGADPPMMDYLTAGYTDVAFIIPGEMCGQAIYDAAVTLATGGELTEKNFVLPTWPITPDDYLEKQDQVWSVMFADLLDY